MVLLKERELLVKTVAVVNHKGGVGKTTTAVCLSGALVEQGKRMLLLDLDPQASASKWLERDDTGRALVETLLDDGDLLPLVFQTADGVIKRLNRALRLAGIVVCQADLRTNHARDVIRALRTKFGADVCDAIIRENTLLAEAVGFRKPITVYDPKSSGAQDYRRLAVEFAHRVGQTQQRNKVHA